MQLVPGDKLGPYTVLALIGRGGMGEVYKAHDSRLRRDVAIKVSHDQFTERFTREARTIASLNHTNICHLYDVGPNYLVMEYVEGETLAGPMTLTEALPVIHQLIDGIEAAHEKNIIHRDLKPANIKITPEGVVKILDFGLAKAMEAPAPDTDPNNSPTLTMGATQAGAILGTAAYMAPEQAKGKVADKRCDIWSFGAVVAEMLTGRRVFGGETAVEILSSVLQKDPDLSTVPPKLQPLLRWCLEKDRKHRLSSISDARHVLNAPEAAPAEAAAPAQAKAGYIATAVFAVAFFALAGWTFTRKPVEAPAPIARFDFTPPPGYTLTGANANGPQMAASPDGRSIAFVADDAKGTSTLWVRAIDSLAAQQLDKTEGAQMPFWSPDSKHIAFFANGKLKRIPLSGGSPVNLCDAPVGTGTWFKPEGAEGDGVILFAPTAGSSPVLRVPAAGGIPVPVTKMEQGEGAHNHPEFLPDGKQFLFLVRSGPNPGLHVQTLGSDQRTFLLDALSLARIVPPDYLIYRRGTTLLAQHWDWASMKPLSEPVALADGVRGATNGLAAASVSSSVLAYRPGRQGGGRQFRWFSRTGKEEQTATPVGDLGIVEMSPDGHKALIAISSGQARDLFLLDLATGVLSALTSDPAIETDPVWSPDSRRIVFSRDGDKAGLYHMVLGSGKATLVYPNTQRLEAWTSEGLLTRDRVLALVPAPEENVSGPITAKPRVLAELPNTDQFRVSPDGKWVTFTSGGTDRAAEAREVWVAAFPSFTDRRKIANGEAPLWRADGKELVFLSPGAGLMSASVKPGVTLEVGPPKLLFNPAAAPIENAQGHNYALSNDGNRLLLRVDTSDKGNEAEPLHVILNWQSLLK